MALHKGLAIVTVVGLGGAAMGDPDHSGDEQEP
jgi:hypothetical protein